MDTQKIMVIRQNVDGDSRSGEELYYSLDGDQASVLPRRGLARLTPAPGVPGSRAEPEP